MANSTTTIVAATTIMPTSTPAIGPAGDTGDLYEPGDGGRDNAGVVVTGSGVLLGLVSMVGTRGPVLLLTGDGGRDNAGVLVTGSGVLLGLVSMVDTRGPVLLLTGTVVPETKMNMKGVSGTDKGRGTDNYMNA